MSTVFSRTRRAMRASGPLLPTAAAIAAILSPVPALACACGCAVFDVGTSTLLPSGPGGTVFVEWDYLNQHINWAGNSSAPSANNDDKQIRSNFMLLGGQYMFNDDWGAMVELPVTQRYFRTEQDDGSIGAFDHTAFGDMRVMGVYSGFSPDMSSGLIFGMKLPTGDFKYPNFDPDTEIGSGSTDVLLGGYHSGQFGMASPWGYFVQLLWQHEISTQNEYRPGPELNGAAGVSYSGTKIGNVTVTPVVQLLLSDRGRDGEANGDPDNTGYTRLLISPGVSVSYNAMTFYTDVEVPIYQHMNGNQLISPVAVKLIASYNF